MKFKELLMWTFMSNDYIKRHSAYVNSNDKLAIINNNHFNRAKNYFIFSFITILVAVYIILIIYSYLYGTFLYKERLVERRLDPFTEFENARVEKVYELIDIKQVNSLYMVTLKFLIDVDEYTINFVYSDVYSSKVVTNRVTHKNIKKDSLIYFNDVHPGVAQDVTIEFPYTYNVYKKVFPWYIWGIDLLIKPF